MANITSDLVKKLREKTGAGMMDCKKALTAAEGDLEKAVDQLRKTGAAKAAKKADRSANEGIAKPVIKEQAAVMVEVLCETDFAAKNDNFEAYVTDLADRILANYESEQDLTGELPEQEHDKVAELVSQIGENIQPRRAIRWEGSGVFGSYMHMGGKIGVLAEIEGDGATDELAKNVCMHIAAFSPAYISPDDIPETKLESEREVAKAQVSDKPAHILDKIVEGKISKWYSEVCLTKQPWLRDDKTCLDEIAPNVTVKRFLRWAVGEEIS